MDINILEKELKEFKKVIQGLEAKIIAYDIDRQNYVKRENVLKPSSGCKVFYDKNGLVLRAESLSVDDIPTIPMEKVSSLKESLNDAMTKHLSIKERDKIPPGEGFKIAYNEYGDVVSSVDKLHPSDIPSLPISKIESLHDQLELIHHTLKALQEENDHNSPHITPMIATKVQVDGMGRVIKGMNLSMDDLPNEIMIQLNRLETSISTIPNVLNMKKNISSLDDRLVELQDQIENLPRSNDHVKNDEKYEILKKELLSLKDSIGDKAELKHVVALKNDFESVLIKAKSAEKILIGLDHRVNEVNRHIAVLSNKFSNMENTIHNLVSVYNVESQIESLKEEIKNIQEKLK